MYILLGFYCAERMCDMTLFRNDVAVKCGVNAAIIADLLWHIINDNSRYEKRRYFYGSNWCRCSLKSMTIKYPYLTRNMAGTAVRRLIDQGIIIKACLNDSRFDHTNWYAFTEYGARLMMGDDAEW